MSKIVVSYRRSNSAAVAGRIVDRLIAYFGEDAIFLDVDNIPFGTDFRQHIQSVLSSAVVLIAIVGPDWLGVEDNQIRRIDREDDPVRVEIETALRLKLTIIPLLVNNASMPNANMLPEGLQNFAFINAAPVDVGRDFRPHVDRVIQTIEPILKSKSHDPANTPAAISGRSHLGAALAAAAALLVVCGAAAVWHFSSQPSPAPAAAAPPVTIASADDSDWTVAQNADSYAAYAAYVKRHPKGQHVTEAKQAAIAHALKSEPGLGELSTDETVLVDDRTCEAGEIKAVTGGSMQKRVARTRKCVPQDQPF